jgi:hypothetical protein
VISSPTECAEVHGSTCVAGQQRAKAKPAGPEPSGAIVPRRCRSNDGPWRCDAGRSTPRAVGALEQAGYGSVTTGGRCPARTSRGAGATHCLVLQSGTLRERERRAALMCRLGAISTTPPESIGPVTGPIEPFRRMSSQSARRAVDVSLRRSGRHRPAEAVGSCGEAR